MLVVAYGNQFLFLNDMGNFLLVLNVFLMDSMFVHHHLYSAAATLIPPPPWREDVKFCSYYDRQTWPVILSPL